MAYTEEPWFCIWMLLSDGTLLAITYDKDENIYGWHRHSIGGNGFIESIAVITGGSGIRDELWMAVNRSGVRTMEYMGPGYFGQLTQPNAIFLDQSVVYTGAPVVNFTGLPYPNGTVVSVLADGATLPDVTVTGGATTIQTAASTVRFGFRYTMQIITNRFEGGGDTGSSQGLIKRITKLTMRLVKSLGGFYGIYQAATAGGVNQVDEINYRTALMQMDVAPLLYTGDVTLDFPGGYDTDQRIIITQSDPLPFCLTLLTPQTHTYDRD
jgi:hypothetical protein